MARKWMKAAVKVPGRDAGVMDRSSGTRKVVVHTEGVLRGKNGRDGNAISLAKYVARENIGYHFVYDRAGRFAQIYPANVSSRSLLAGRWSPNRQGEVAIQICFAGISDAKEIEDWPMKNWDKFLRFTDKWRVPRKKQNNWNHPSRSESVWRQSGWHSHASAPFNDHVDGQGAPIRKMLKSKKKKRVSTKASRRLKKA